MKWKISTTETFYSIKICS